MKRFAICGSILLWSCVALAQAGADLSSEKSRLIALENAWNQAQIHHDSQALNQPMADTFVYTDWDGTVMSKTQYLADLRDPSVQTTVVANDKVEVHLYARAAVVTGAYHAKGSSRGNPFDHHGRFTDTWIMFGNEWMCVASHTNLSRK